MRPKADEAGAEFTTRQMQLTQKKTTEHQTPEKRSEGGACYQSAR